MNNGCVHDGVGPGMFLTGKFSVNAGKNDLNQDNCTVLFLIALCKYYKEEKNHHD